jgi:hypothetical protein
MLVALHRVAYLCTQRAGDFIHAWAWVIHTRGLVAYQPCTREGSSQAGLGVECKTRAASRGN